MRAIRPLDNPPLHWTAAAEHSPLFEWSSARPRPVNGSPLFSGGNLPIPDEIDDRMTPESLDALAGALSVRWPEWYPTFALELAAKSSESRPFWLPGGFVFASPRRAFEETTAFRRGEKFYSGAPSIDEAGPEWPPRPLPDRYVLVGRTGEGPVIVDTATDAPVLFWLDKEGTGASR